MATSNPLDILLAQNRWANRNLIESCSALSDEQFHQRFEMGLGSLHDTITHILGAMRGWGDMLAPEGPEVVAQLVEKGTERRLAYYWLVGTEGVLVETLRSFLGLERSELRRSHAQLAVRLSTGVGSGVADERARAARQLEAIYRQLEPALKAAEHPAPAPSSDLE